MNRSKKLFSMILAVLLTMSVLIPTSVFGYNPIDKSANTFKNQDLVRLNVNIKAGDHQVKGSIEALGGKIVEDWSFISGLLVEIEENKIKQLETLAGVLHVSPEGKMVEAAKGPGPAFDTKVIANAYNAAVKADKVIDKGITGKGVTVVVVDSGINEKDGKSDFNGRVVTSIKMNSNTSYSSDKFGHGTHVAGIIGGDGGASRGKYLGVAPEVNLINVKFSDDEGKASEQDLVNALQWIYDNHQQYNIRVVNISSGVGTKQSYHDSPTSAAVEQLWNKGIVVVVSAGNRGSELCSTCYAPANDPYVITVGAIDDNGTKDLADDKITSWSSHGLTLDGHSKPEVVAPGAKIVSYMPGGDLRKIAPNNVVDGDYFKMGGTSMAAPVISGIVALMLQNHPEWTPDQVKWLLMNNIRPYLDNNNVGNSAGLVAADNAVFYDGTPQSANKGLTPNRYIVDSKGKPITWSNMSWANMSWANMSWANSLDK